VLVEHRNVVNFFRGMDDVLAFKEPGTWLAVTSISFDISVQELFWTLTRGFKVIIQEEQTRDEGPEARSEESVSARSASQASLPSPLARHMEFSLFYFAADAGESNQSRYRLLLEGARFADQNGFAAVWTPERHFHAFGGLYPNPSLTGAAVAAITSRVQIRAGSIVLPLHNPIRVAEEWAVVDNLSQGRVGLSFASGWHANDFALMPQNYVQRKDVMMTGIDTIRRLWRGEAVPALSGSGKEIEVRIFPAPVQAEPPIWLTSAGNVETFRQAGLLGFNVLTNLLGQQPQELAEKIAAYRLGRQERGHAGRGQVTLMLHTFIGPDLEQVRRKIRQPFLDYLKTSTDLIKKARWEFPAFAAAAGQKLESLDDDQLSDADMRVLMDFAFERYFKSSGLFGTPEMGLQMVERLKAIDVDEIACLIDFGVDSDSVLESLHYLNEVRLKCDEFRLRFSAGRPQAENEDYSIAQQMKKHGVTHLQCTPSLARILVSESDSLEALKPLSKLMVGGEALPPALAEQLAGVVSGDLINVYGPTETTVWSTAARIDKSGGPITIGRPIANTQLYVVDRFLRPLPLGVAGELLIGGHGVVRGYLNQPQLTDERFIPDLFGPKPGMRLYRTGDLVRYREDGQLEFLGRLDHQVKIRGHRIELGEIEAVLASHPAVRECVVVAHDQAGDQNLFAYVAPNPACGLAPPGADVGHWRALWDTTYATPVVKAASFDQLIVKAGSIDNADPALNTSGWTSSYTGERIPDAEMLEWVQHTVGRILALKPKRVLEIGCGTGMLLLRIAPNCEHYCGVDFSANALRTVEIEIGRRGLGNVTLVQSAADELTGLEPGSFDVVVLNSVIQYFPSAEYLVRVLERVTPLVRDGGTIFIGDVRNLALQEAFHTSVALEQAPADLEASELRERVRQRLERDSELVLDPAFFGALRRQLPRIGRVTIQLKRGRFANEMIRFRYEVLLAMDRQPAHAGGGGGPPACE
jgi:natural product biosynthesis luciferase-like monooxygenase protein